MKRKDILDALGQIDGKYLLETSPDRPYRRAVIQRCYLKYKYGQDGCS